MKDKITVCLVHMAWNAIFFPDVLAIWSFDCVDVFVSRAPTVRRQTQT